jgi:putative hemolysin
MTGSGQGRYAARRAAGAADVARALALRAARFRAGAAADADADADAYDAAARHILVEETATGRLVACCRLTAFRDGSELGRAYAAQFYGLDGLARRRGPMLEVGRFCVAAGEGDPAALRLAWGALAREAAAEEAELLFGCSSFAGVEVEPYAEVFALLGARHLGPPRWRPRATAPVVFRFAQAPRRPPDEKAALRAMPPLLRAYLAMGGWVSDHAVVDRDLGTLHVFTALEVRRVPAARLRALGVAA